jgi:hypothetical protein
LIADVGLSQRHLFHLGPRRWNLIEIQRAVGFVKVRATHAFEHRLVLGELDIRVLHNLNPVSPRIPKLHPSSGQGLDAGLLEPPSDFLLFVHHEAKMAFFVGTLNSAFG